MAPTPCGVGHELAGGGMVGDILPAPCTYAGPKSSLIREIRPVKIFELEHGLAGAHFGTELERGMRGWRGAEERLSPISVSQLIILSSTWNIFPTEFSIEIIIQEHMQKDEVNTTPAHPVSKMDKNRVVQLNFVAEIREREHSQDATFCPKLPISCSTLGHKMWYNPNQLYASSFSVSHCFYSSWTL
ncbi:uncharacterized protein BDR25DRAFT_360969 [Lindgomyces ingoldianus]|uniref:Uncharacterized protein n=1 Tax=Lindgomyces ingoldianus TaxID=673940 RepID=A0ACB6QG08_9PLEO|nr:uncharacterized protein BDR25DRAFT_360969 [Lindgomyces ingoldianus]KAF2465066.1 hypothetical protein BDR25DRAFT_360969 [Lindgomyces ingoldianus]